MNCKKCGAPIDANTKFCGNCGTPVEPTNIGPVQSQQMSNPQPVQPQQNLESMTQQNVETIMMQQPNQLPIMDVNNGVVPPINNLSVQQTSNDIESEKKKKSVLPIILVMFILLGVGGFLAYKYSSNKSDKVVKSLINKAYEKFETPLEIISKSDTVLINTEMSINTNIPGLEDLNTMKFNTRYGIDNKNNKYEFGLAYLEDNTKIFDIIMYMLDKDGYLLLNDVYSNPLKLDLSEEDLEEFKKTTNQVSPKDIEYLSEKFKNILIKSLDSNDFKQSTTTITLNGSETKVKKINYTLNQEKMTKLINTIIDNMLKDEEFINKLSEMTNTDSEIIIEDLKESKIDTADDTIDNDEIIVFDIYTKGATDEFVGMDIESSDNTNIKIRKNTNNTTISANIEGTSIVMTIKKENENKTTIDIKINALTKEITGLITIEKNQVDSKTTETKTTFNMKYEKYEVEIILNSKQQIGVDIADIDISNAKAIDELTEEENLMISSKLEEKMMNSKLYNLVDSAMNSLLRSMAQKMEQEYYNDYDYNV